jgi:hypothetical protein
MDETLLASIASRDRYGATIDQATAAACAAVLRGAATPEQVVAHLGHLAAEVQANADLALGWQRTHLLLLDDLARATAENERLRAALHRRAGRRR